FLRRAFRWAISSISSPGKSFRASRRMVCASLRSALCASSRNACGAPSRKRSSNVGPCACCSLRSSDSVIGLTRGAPQLPPAASVEFPTQPARQLAATLNPAFRQDSGSDQSCRRSFLTQIPLRQDVAVFAHLRRIGRGSVRHPAIVSAQTRLLHLLRSQSPEKCADTRRPLLRLPIQRRGSPNWRQAVRGLFA